MKNILNILLLASLFMSCEKNEDMPVACFEYTHNYTAYSGPGITRDSVIFTNCSQNATSYLWDFGDGTTSTEVNPVHIYENTQSTVVRLTAYNGANSDVIIDTIFDWIVVYKPNIYIYPESTIDLCLNLTFPKGGHVVSSIPEYNDGWCITVEPSGLINENFNFLFYESIQPNIWQKEKGWVIRSDELSHFFIGNMQDYGFNENEINDFINYWIPLLDKSDYYAIYPQTNYLINQVIALEFSVEPQNLNRLYYVIEALEGEMVLPKPIIEPFNREKFHIIEWGVVL